MKKEKLLRNIAIIALAIIINLGVINSVNASTYNYSASNILDNVTKDGNDVIIPIIYSKSGETINKEKVISEFKNKNLTVKSIPDKIGTGTQITVNENNLTYNILIYGDVNGDGKINIQDVRKMILSAINPDKQLTGIYYTAANIGNNDNKINIKDVRRSINFILKSSSIVFNAPEITTVDITPTNNTEQQTTPTDNTQQETTKDTVAPQITLKGLDMVTLKLGVAYTEPGATATDNVDTSVNVVIDSSSVNTNKVGIYTVTYNATDASGNKAEQITRLVNVVDYIKNVTFTKPTKTTYVVGDTIDLTNGKINIEYASGASEQVVLATANVSGYNNQTNGTQTITLSYTTSNTIDDVAKTYSDTYAVLVEKKLANIVVTNKVPEDILCYNTVEIASLTSGADEEKLDLSKYELTFDIKKIVGSEEVAISDSDTVTKVTTETLADNSIKVLFTAKDAGKYKVTPKVSVSAETTIQGEAINNIIVSEDTSVNMIDIYDMEETNKVDIANVEFVQATAKTLYIDFYHKYTNTDYRKVNIDIKENTIVTTANISLLNSSDVILTSETTEENSIVSKVSIKPSTVGENTLTITVDESLGLQTTINAERINIVINEDSDSITLYKSANANAVTADGEYDDAYYTLISVKKDGNNILANEIKNFAANGNIRFVFVPLNEEEDYILYNPFSSNVIMDTVNDTMEYIGIAISDDADDEYDINGSQIVVYYGEDIIHTMTITVVD